MFPTMIIIYTVSAAFQISLESVAATAVAVTGGHGFGGQVGSTLGFDLTAVSGSGGSAGFLWLQKLWMAAGDTYDVVFFMAATWYMLRFFR